MSLVDYAQKEIELIREPDDSHWDTGVMDSALEIVALFAGQGHSGASAEVTTQMVMRLMRFKPLSPLTGADDEWTNLGKMAELYMTHQNKRLSSVFKDDQGRAYDIDQGGTREGPFISFPYDAP